MNWINILGVAIGLAMDALAVSIAAGIALERLTPRHVFRLSFHFGLFQFLMPVLGWLAGTTIASYISDYDHWVAFALLLLIGGRMIRDARSTQEPESRPDPTRGWTLVTLSIATSLDALAVGLSMAFMQVSIWAPSIVIGIVACALTAIGISFGSRIGRRFGRWAEAFGGLVLIGIGTRILVTSLMG